MKTILTLDGISKKYDQPNGELTILDNLNFSIDAGEAVAIVGPSGSGKSTFLNIASGLDLPTSGTVQINDSDLTTLDDVQLSKLRLETIGFIFQQHHLLPQCTALENILMPTLPLGTKNVATEKAMELLKAVGLEQRAHHLPSMLSGGECQRVAVARALINNPTLLFADEPTGSLDNQSVDEISDLILELNSTYNTTLVVVTHSDSVADRMQRKLTLHNGTFSVIK